MCSIKVTSAMNIYATNRWILPSKLWVNEIAIEDVVSRLLLLSFHVRCILFLYTVQKLLLLVLLLPSLDCLIEWSICFVLGGGMCMFPKCFVPCWYHYYIWLQRNQLSLPSSPHRVNLIFSVVRLDSELEGSAGCYNLISRCYAS